MRQSPLTSRLLTTLSALCLGACSEIGLAVVNAPAKWNGDLDIETASFAQDLSLDIYLPSPEAAQTRIRRDMVVFFYGGRWTGGSKDDYPFIGARLVEAGFIAVIPDYRKYPDVRFPAFVEDGAAAIRWITRNRDRFPRFSGRIHVLGHSAGAHIGALLVADKSYGVAGQISSFAGLAGPYDFTPEAADVIDIFGPPARYAQMQATTFVTGDEPPMLLLHGEEDSTVAAYNHERLATAIRRAGGKVAVKTYPGVTHLGIIKAFTWLEPDSRIAADVADFFSGR